MLFQSKHNKDIQSYYSFKVLKLRYKLYMNTRLEAKRFLPNSPTAILKEQTRKAHDSH